MSGEGEQWEHLRQHLPLSGPVMFLRRMRCWPIALHSQFEQKLSIYLFLFLSLFSSGLKLALTCITTLMSQKHNFYPLFLFLLNRL